MSPRAAARLETLGFRRVHDYKAGKMDWLAFALPVEGWAADEPTAGAAARRDAPRCDLGERLGDLAPRLGADWPWCAVVDARGVLLGRVRRQQVREAPEALAGDAMEPGPSTYRPSLPAAELGEAMQQYRLEGAYVTDSDGRLLGLVTRSDLE